MNQTETFQQKHDVKKTTQEKTSDGTVRRFHHLNDGRIIEAKRVTEFKTEYIDTNTKEIIEVQK